MKKLIYFLLFLLMMEQVMGQVPTNGLVAYYPFSGNANEASGNGLNGSLSTPPPTLGADRLNTINSAYNFTTGNNIVVLDNPNLNNFGNGITVGAWIRLPSIINQSYRIIDKTPVGQASGFVLDIYNGRLRFVGVHSSINFSSTVNILANAWVHVAATYNHTNNNLVFYINGIQSGSFQGNQIIQNNSTNLRFGQDQNGGSQMFGSIDEVVLYNRPLAPCEINQLAGIINAPLSTPVFTTTPPAAGCAGGVTNYSITAVPNAVSYQWSVDGIAVSGATGLTFSKSWVSADGGNRTVSVVARTPCFTSPALSSNISITAPAKPSSITGPTSVCINTTPKYVISAGVAGTSYTWSLAGIPLTDFTGNIAYVNLATAGTQSLSVTPSLNGCAGPSNSTSITVNDVPPTPVFSTVPPESVCAGTYSAFAITAIPGAGYEWRIGNALDGTLNASASWSKILANGNNIVSVVATRDCSPYLPAYKSSPLVTSVNVLAAPTNPGSISALNGVNYACLGIDKTYQIPAPVAGVFCEWTLINTKNGTSTILDQTGRTCTVNLPSTDSYTLTARTYRYSDPNIKCYSSNILSTIISVNDGPKIPVITGNLIGCQYTNGNIYSVSPIDPTSKYTWATDNGVVNGINSADIPKGYRTFVNFPDINPSVSVLNYTMSVSATNLCGSALVQLKDAKVNNNFPVRPKIKCVATSCAQLQMETAIPNTGITWTVYNSDGTKTNYTTPTIANPGNLQISLTVSNGTSSDNVACKYTAWYRPCDGTTGTFGRLGEELELPVPTSYLIYPNPSSGSVTIETKGQSGKAYVFNTFGQVVAEVELNKYEYVYSVNLPAKGLYTFKIKADGETAGYKVVVE